MATTEPGDDAGLLARLRDDEAAVRRAAEHELFVRFHAPLERLLTRLLGHDVDDCLQEVFVDVLRGLPAFEGRSRLSTWVYRVALHRAWKCLAERRRRGERTEEGEQLVERAPARGAGVAEQVESAELARRFAAALERLDLDQRTVVALAAVDGLGPPEIARVLGVPVGTVHSRLHRARRRLRERLGLGEPAP